MENIYICVGIIDFESNFSTKVSHIVTCHATELFLDHNFLDMELELNLIRVLVKRNPDPRSPGLSWNQNLKFLTSIMREKAVAFEVERLILIFLTKIKKIASCNLEGNKIIICGKNCLHRIENKFLLRKIVIRSTDK